MVAKGTLLFRAPQANSGVYLLESRALCDFSIVCQSDEDD